MGSEPSRLKRGRRFHRRVQDDWQETAEGTVHVERTIKLLPSSGRVQRIRRGRMDIFVEPGSDFVTVVEIKATDWDRIKARNHRRNLSNHRRQVWRYIEKYLDGDGQDVCAGIIYPSAPTTPGLKEQVEEYLNDFGLQVVWYDD